VLKTGSEIRASELNYLADLPAPERRPLQKIEIRILDNHSFEVCVEAKSPTVHIVSLQPAYAEKLTGGKVSAEVLIEKSFEFLLARESNTSILRSFDLAVIARYFPDYEDEIAGHLVQHSHSSS